MKYIPTILEAGVTVFSILFGIGFVIYAHNAGM